MTADTAEVVELKFETEGVPADLAELVRTDEKLHASLRKMQATGLRLVLYPSGWTDPRSGESNPIAYEALVLGRPDTPDTTYAMSAGQGGRCFVKDGGRWRIEHIACF